MSDIKYTKILVRNGERKDLPLLDNAEFGYANDTGQLFIGADPSQNTNLYGRRIILNPIPNVRNYVQSLLNDHALYNVYSVTSELYIDTESSSKAIEVMNYINNQVALHYSNIKAIATISTNIELITSQNIAEYSNPSLDVVNYNPTDGFANPNRKVLSKILTLNNGDVFLEYNRRECSNIIVDYTLVQNNGEHKRSGRITVVGDNNVNNPDHISFSDDQTKILDGYSSTHIRFYTQYNNGKIQIKFSQPPAHQTKIFFRVIYWGIDQLSGITNQHITPNNELIGIGLGENNILGFDTDIFIPDSGGSTGSGSGGSTGSGGSATGATVLTDLNDVTILNPFGGQVLRYNGSMFVNQFLSYDDLTNKPTHAPVAFSGSYNDLIDVPTISILPSGTEGDYLYHDGNSWVPRKIIQPYSMGFACSDEKTPIASNISEATTIYSVTQFKLKKIKFGLNSISSTLSLDLKINGNIIYTATISSNILTYNLPSDILVDEDDVITVDITSVGDGLSTGLKVYLYGEI